MLSTKPWAAALAAASIALTACGGGDDTSTPAEDTSSDDTGSSTASASVSVLGTDGLKFDPGTVTAAAGDVSIELTSGSAVQHTLVIEGIEGDEPILEAAAGESATATVTLTAGTYTFYCDVAGHREAGMEGTLTVS